MNLAIVSKAALAAHWRNVEELVKVPQMNMLKKLTLSDTWHPESIPYYTPWLYNPQSEPVLTLNQNSLDEPCCISYAPA